MDKYKSKIEGLIKELKSNRGVEIVTAKIGKRADPELLAKNRRVQYFDLPDEIIEFYQEMNGFKIEWKNTNESDYAHGWARMPSFEELLHFHKISVQLTGQGILPEFAIKYADKPVPENFFGSDEEAEDLELIYHWRRYFLPLDFDFGGPCSGEGEIGLYFGDPENPVVYLIGDGEIHPTGHSFAEYIDALVKVRCVYYWQKCLTTSGLIMTPGLAEDFEALFNEKLTDLVACKTEAEAIRSADQFIDTYSH